MPQPRIIAHVPIGKLGKVVTQAWATVPRPAQVIVVQEDAKAPNGDAQYTVTIKF